MLLSLGRMSRPICSAHFIWCTTPCRDMQHRWHDHGVRHGRAPVRLGSKRSAAMPSWRPCSVARASAGAIGLNRPSRTAASPARCSCSHTGFLRSVHTQGSCKACTSTSTYGQAMQQHNPKQSVFQ